MRTPLTTDQAIKQFQCSECKTGLASFCSCVESATCSFTAPCDNRVWFEGSWTDPDIPDTFTCPYCGKKHDSPYRSTRLVEQAEDPERFDGLS